MRNLLLHIFYKYSFYLISREKVKFFYNKIDNEIGSFKSFRILTKALHVLIQPNIKLNPDIDHSSEEFTTELSFGQFLGVPLKTDSISIVNYLNSE